MVKMCLKIKYLREKNDLLQKIAGGHFGMCILIDACKWI